MSDRDGMWDLLEPIVREEDAKVLEKGLVAVWNSGHDDGFQEGWNACLRRYNFPFEEAPVPKEKV